MKWQVSRQKWRLRISEDELQHLRIGQPLASTTVLPGGGTFRFLLELAPSAEAGVDRDGDAWKFTLPAASVEAYVQRLPCREGLDFTLPVATDVVLQLIFEVDVRDSVRQRGVGPRRR